MDYFVDRDQQPVRRASEFARTEVLFPDGTWGVYPVDMAHDATSADSSIVSGRVNGCDPGPKGSESWGRVIAQPQ